MFECKIISPLNKVFPDGVRNLVELKKISVLRGETVSFQILYRWNEGFRNDLKVVFKDSALAKHVVMRRENLVAGLNLGNISNPGHPCQEHYEKLYPGLFPDLLTPDMEHLSAVCNNWHAVWCDVVVPEKFKAGSYTLEAEFTCAETVRKISVKVEVINAVLPPQTLKHTEWFYCDCISMAHNVTPWTPEFWTILEKYFQNFSSHGMNMLLTPIFTPPLDTEINGERLTTQLVGVVKKGGKYSFNFDNLRKWVALAKKCGIRYFEFSHLFTQWGAKATPKVIATVNGREKRIFGWDVASDSKAYADFLDAFLPELKKVISELKIKKNSFFHVSDEPRPEHEESYRKASNLLKKHLSDFVMMDACSDTVFFTKGLVKFPVPAEFAFRNFEKLNVPERWIYYCCAPELPWCNRFHCMPAISNRIWGTLLYMNEIKGILHWGYNFWNFGMSGRYAEPSTPRADILYRDGDSCLVYPGKDGPYCTMREETLFHGLQDMRALQLLESLIGRDKVLKLIAKSVKDDKLYFDHYPFDAAVFHKLREDINKAIAKAVN